MWISKKVSRRYIFILVVIIALILLTTPFLIQEVEKPGDSIRFETLDYGLKSGKRYDDHEYTGEYIVVRNQTSWADFWIEHSYGISDPPNISWDNQIVLMAMHGWASSSGDKWIEFTSVRKDGRTLVAYVERIDKGGVAGMMITNPYHIIVVERASEVVFIEDYETEYGLNWWVVLLLVGLVAVAIMLYFREFRIKPENENQSPSN